MSQTVFDLHEKPRSPTLAHASAAEIREGVARKKFSAREVMQETLAGVREREPQVRAWEFLDPEQALARASELDRKLNAGHEAGSLAGVPIGVKDVFNTVDMPTGMGSELWKGFTPGNDARAVHNLKIEDGLVLGKTVTAEFAVHYLAAEKTLNPQNPKHIPGTSSSGSAAAVAAYMTPLALGTQTAGSIIRPASFCGVLGFKPTFGTIARTGVLKTTDTLDTIGAFARTVEDLEISFEALRVRGRDYPLVHEKLKKPENFSPRVAFLREGIHVIKNFPGYALDALAKCEADIFPRLGHWKKTSVKLPALVDQIHPWHESIYDKTLSYYFKQESQQYDRISSMIQSMIDRGNRIPIETYTEAVERQAEAREIITAALAEVDVLITLSTAGEAPVLGVNETPDTCLIWTFLGFPALSLPLFRGPGGLPFGLQIVGKRYDDYKVLRAARELLAALGLEQA